MTIKDTPLVRRDFLRGALATAVMLPFGVTLASCSSGGGSTGGGASEPAGGAATADNPFGVAATSTVDAVIFNGGYGIAYAEFAGKLVEKEIEGVTVKVSPQTNIAQTLQPRFVSGNPPDVIDNSGANLISINTIKDQLEDLTTVVDAKNYEGKVIKDTLYPGVLAPGTLDGKLVALNYALTVFSLWYSASLFDANGWTVPKTWEEMLDLGAKAKDKGKYLMGWGKEAATYYQTLAIGSAIKEGGDDVRLALDNLKPGCWSLEPVQGVFQGLKKIIDAGYMKPGGAGTQFTAAQAQWSSAEDFLLYPSGSWIENEMKKDTKADFKMTGVQVPTVTSSPKFPWTALHLAAAEAYIVPSNAKNPAGGKEFMRAMLSQDAAVNFAKTNLASTIVKDTIPADGFGSTALVSQLAMLKDAGTDVFTWGFVDLYGMNVDMLVVWNTFLQGGSDVKTLTSALQTITDNVANDSSVQKVTVS